MSVYAPAMRFGVIVLLAACAPVSEQPVPDFDPGDAAFDASFADAAPDVATADAVVAADSSAADTSRSDSGPDSGAADARREDSGPAGACDAGSACNAWLGPEGACPGTCIAQPQGLTCRGQADQGVCRRLPPDRSNAPLEAEGLRIETLEAPAVAQVGETHRVELRVTNLGAASATWPFTPRHPDTWELMSSSFEGLSMLALDAGASATLSADLLALRPDVLQPYGGVILSVAIGPLGYDVYGAIAFDADQPIACGDGQFPATWCAEPGCSQMGTYYTSARCCGDVFFPGAYCCEDAECGGGICADGKCVRDVPSSGFANSLPIGHQRIGLILVDSHPIAGGSVCADRSAELGPELGLDEVEAFFDAMSLQRTGSDLLSLDWFVMAGPETADFLAEGQSRYWPTYGPALEAHLASLGCPGFSDFDKVIVSSPLIDLQGMGGQAFGDGQIAVLYADNPLLLAHELGHTWGASDLYLDLGGPTVYLFDLMGNNLGGFGAPEDAVLWAEVGLADVDGSGAIDAFEFAAFPEALELRTLRALLTGRPTLEIQIGLGGLEDGVVKKIVLNQLRVDLPEYGAGRDQLQMGTTKTVVFDGSELPLETVDGRGQVEVRVRASLSFTGRDWTRRRLELDQVRVLEVEH